MAVRPRGFKPLVYNQFHHPGAVKEDLDAILADFAILSRESDAEAALLFGTIGPQHEPDGSDIWEGQAQ